MTPPIAGAHGPRDGAHSPRDGAHGPRDGAAALIAAARAGATLIAAAHGTRDGRDCRTIEGLLDLVRARRPDVTVRAAYLQFAAPSVASALAEPGGGAKVVVPLLLSTGYHLRVDLPAALDSARSAAGAGTAFGLAPALGPHELLADALIGRLTAAGWTAGVPIVLGAAGSTDPRAATYVRAMARLLALRTGVRVGVGFAAGGAPTIADAVARLRRTGSGAVAVASYLIAPGRFHDVAAASGADLVSGPLADHPSLARLVLHRYEAALGAQDFPAA